MESEIIVSGAIIVIIALIVALVLFIRARPETHGFTELSFVAPVPELVSKHEPAVVSFAIHNREKHEMLYRYEISLGNEQLGSGSVLIAHGELKTIEHAFIASEQAPTPAALSVRLMPTNQEIHAWITVS